MAALVTSRTTDLNTRVEDYLSDKLQTSADLENVNDLLVRVNEQQTLLRRQLSQARSRFEEAELTSNSHVQALRERTTAFQREQADIDRRLQILTQSEVSDDAVRIFETRMSKLKRLEIASGYVEILREVDTLVSDARVVLKKEPAKALANHTRVRMILNSLYTAQPAAEGAAPHLVNHIEHRVNGLYQELKSSLEIELQSTLDKMAWPKKELKLPEHLVQKWQRQVGSLLELQEAELGATQSDQSMSMSLPSLRKPVVLLPLEVIVKPLVLRFQYHFYGDRPTNRLDKPEYFFSHTLDLIEQHSPFMTQMLQPILDSQVLISEHLESVCTDAVSAFITALLPMVSAKCLSLLPQISTHPQLLSHFVHEMMAFDNTLRDFWAYTPSPDILMDWKGITSEILDTHGYFNTWLNMEKDFALSRYGKIRDSPDSGNIDQDGVEKGRTKPTKGAIRVNDLLETITDRYRHLPSFSQKMKFLMEIQLSIFDDYHGHLHGALQAYLVGSHTAGRFIQGQTADETLGLKGLETLTKIFGSSEYLERKMSDWSDDVFFLELWDELQDRARRNVGANGSVGRDLRMDEVAAKTSSSIKTANTETDHDGGALFDETAASYRDLRQRSESEIVRALEINVRNAVKPFTRVSIWSSVSSTSSVLSPSSALDTLLNTLSTLLGFLSRVLAPTPMRRIARTLCATIQKEIYDNIVLRHSFSAAGAAQLRRDMVAVQGVIESSTQLPGEAQRSMAKLDEALVLLNLPIRTSRNLPALEGDDGDDWGFDEGAGSEDVASTDPDHELVTTTTADSEKAADSWGLWDVEKAIFASNESARKVLTELQLEHLNETEARTIVTKRVEINS